MRINDILSKENKALLSELVRTDFKLRYQGSVLGYTWSLLRPLFMFAILYVVFVKFLRIGGDIPNYPLYLLLGIVLWNFFSEMTAQSLGAIVGRGDLIRKIRIPRWMIIVSTSVSALINLALNLLVFLLFVVLSHAHLSLSILLLPAVLFEVYIFALGISLVLSALFVKYRDINYIWEVFLQAGFYVTPILYPMTLITNPTVQKLLLMNPLAQSIQDARSLVVSSSTTTLSDVSNPFTYILPISVVLVSLIIGVTYFKNQANSFAENI